MRKLEVFFNNEKAGVLSEFKSGAKYGYSFRYYTDYLKTDLPPISLTLPKREEAYEADFLFPFFSNMLPEGANRKIISRGLKVDEDDLFGLLCVMAGKDFIGAVGLRPFNETNETTV